MQRKQAKSPHPMFIRHPPPFRSLSLLILFVVSILCGVNALATCTNGPNPNPQWTAPPDWLTFTTATDFAPNTAPYPELANTITSLAIDTFSPLAPGSGSRIFVGAQPAGSPAQVIQLPGGDTLTTTAGPSIYIQQWNTTNSSSVISLAIDDMTGKVYGLLDVGTICEFRQDGSVQVLLDQTTFRFLYLSATSLNSSRALDTYPTAIAVDSSSMIFVALSSFGGTNPPTASNPLVSVYNPATGILVPLTGSQQVDVQAYATAGGESAVRPQRLFFRSGRLWMVDSRSFIIFRTRFPYSSFSSALDLDSNPFTSVFQNSIAGFFTATVESSTGAVYTVTQGGAQSKEILVRPNFGGSIALTPLESPCLNSSGIQRIGLSQIITPIFDIDPTATPERLYVLDGAGHLGWFEIKVPASLSTLAPGCLTTTQQSTYIPIPAPAYQNVTLPSALPNATSFMSFAARFGIDGTFSLGDGSNGTLFIGGFNVSTNFYCVVKITPGSSRDGSDLMAPLFAWAFSTTSVVVSFSYRAEDDQLFALNSLRQIYQLSPNSSTPTLYADVSTSVAAARAMAIDPQGRFWIVSGTTSITAFVLASGTPQITTFSALKYTQPSVHTEASEKLVNIQFAFGFMYLASTTDILRTLNPYCFQDTNDFTLNPLVSILTTDAGSVPNGFYIEASRGAMMVSMDSQWDATTTYRVQVQYQQIGEGSYVEMPWRLPCLTTVASAFAKKSVTAGNPVGPTRFAVDTTVSPSRVYLLQENTIVYTSLTIQPKLPQSAMACFQAPPPASSSSTASFTSSSASSTGIASPSSSSSSSTGGARSSTAALRSSTSIFARGSSSSSSATALSNATSLSNSSSSTGSVNTTGGSGVNHVSDEFASSKGNVSAFVGLLVGLVGGMLCLVVILYYSMRRGGAARAQVVTRTAALSSLDVQLT